jgi:hypothetical protein
MHEWQVRRMLPQTLPAHDEVSMGKAGGVRSGYENSIAEKANRGIG